MKLVKKKLKIPRPIACLRDILNGFVKLFAGNTECASIKDWVDRPDISEHKTSANVDQSVRLGSTIPFTAKKMHVDQVFETFVVANASNCIYHGDQKTLPPPIANETVIKTVCVPFKLTDEYRVLQWTLNGTSHTENDVLVHQTKCPESLSVSEYKNFGTLRADGHRLQLRKLYAMIETEALSFEKDSVLSLIMQTLWECGIKGDDTTDHAKIIRESHMDFTNEEFCKAVLHSLEKYAIRQENNWMHPVKLTVLNFSLLIIIKLILIK